MNENRRDVFGEYKRQMELSDQNSRGDTGQNNCESGSTMGREDIVDFIKEVTPSVDSSE